MPAGMAFRPDWIGFRNSDSLRVTLMPPIKHQCIMTSISEGAVFQEFQAVAASVAVILDKVKPV